MELKLNKLERREAVKARKQAERDQWDSLTDVQKRDYRKKEILEYCQVFLTEEQILPLKSFEECMLRFRQRKMNKEAWLRKMKQEIKQQKMLENNKKGGSVKKL